MQTTGQDLDITSLLQLFWDPHVMDQWQNILQQENLDTLFYLDLNNILRDRKTGQGVAYVGGVPKKAEMGLQVTNSLRQYTPSFQYIFGVTQPIVRQDNLSIGGSVEELIAEPDIEDWLGRLQNTRQTQLQLYSIIMQLYYASYLLALQGWDSRKALAGIKIRQVAPDVTVPFFDGNILTYGVIPVIYELEVLTESADIIPENSIPHVLDLITGADLWSPEWETLENTYQGMDVTNGRLWNDLIGEDIYSEEPAEFSCLGRQCIGETTGPGSLNINPFGEANAKEVNNFEEANAKGNTRELDLRLLEATNLSLPDHIQPFALAFKARLANLYPTDEVFALQEDANPEIVEEYLDPNHVENTFFQMDNEFRLLLADRNKYYRRMIRSDLEFGSMANVFYVREDFLRPILAGGDVYPFENGTIVEGYNEETGLFTLRQGEGNPFQLGYEELFDYLARTEGVEPYTYRSIPRQDVAIIDGQVSYHNRETDELYPLPEERMYVRNIGNMLQLIYNSQYLLGLGMTNLANEQE